eukprot:m.304025 g.304025  ORF g.304025 m.304025 type:complete len:180 (-) comp16336_c1_seq13:2510-3049(-)
MYELKLHMGHSLIRVQVTDTARFKKTKGYTDAIFQCIGRLAQCVELYFGDSGLPEDGAAIIQVMSSFLPRALVIGDANTYGAVYLRMDKARLDVPGIIPLIVDTTASLKCDSRTATPGHIRGLVVMTKPRLSFCDNTAHTNRDNWAVSPLYRNNIDLGTIRQLDSNSIGSIREEPPHLQ